MTLKPDVYNSIEDVLEFMKNNSCSFGASISSGESASSGSWGLRISWSYKNIFLHSPLSSEWKKVSSSKSKCVQKLGGLNIYEEDRVGLWIGDFETFCHAYTFAELLRRFLYRNLGEEFSLISGEGIKHIQKNGQVYKIF